MTGTWEVHDAVIHVPAGEVGRGTLSTHGCLEGLTFCDVVSDVDITRYGSGLRLTVVHTDALDPSGRRHALPAGFDARPLYASPGDYSILVPFTAADWPFSSTLTTELQRAVFRWNAFHDGQPPVLTRDPLGRMCRVPFPAGLNVSTFCGA